MADENYPGETSPAGQNLPPDIQVLALEALTSLGEGPNEAQAMLDLAGASVDAHHAAIIPTGDQADTAAVQLAVLQQDLLTMLRMMLACRGEPVAGSAADDDTFAYVKTYEEVLDPERGFIMPKGETPDNVALMYATLGRSGLVDASQLGELFNEAMSAQRLSGQFSPESEDLWSQLYTSLHNQLNDKLTGEQHKRFWEVERHKDYADMDDSDTGDEDDDDY